MLKYSDYLNLSISAPRRLQILKNAADELNARSYNGRKNANDPRPYTWRDMRYSGFHNSRGNRCELSPGFNDNGRGGKTAVHYCHTGAYFPREMYADEIENSPIDHQGWFADSDGCRGVIRGIVVYLSHGRMLYGYEVSDSGERVYFTSDIRRDDDPRDVARWADNEAQYLAEIEREYNERWGAARDLDDEQGEKIERLRECLALRNNPCFARLRVEALGLIDRIREIRDTLKTEYADIEI